MDRPTGLRMAFFSLLFAAGCATNAQLRANPDGSPMSAPEFPRLSSKLEYQAAEPQTIELVRSKIQEFELTSQRRTCKDVQFAGYDGDGNTAGGPGETRIKASALSSCGPSYYWFKKREETGGRITSLEIEARSPQKGDRVLVRGTYGKWEFVKQR